MGFPFYQGLNPLLNGKSNKKFMWDFSLDARLPSSSWLQSFNLGLGLVLTTTDHTISHLHFSSKKIN